MQPPKPPPVMRPPMKPGRSLRRFDHDVEFAATHFVKIAQAVSAIPASIGRPVSRSPSVSARAASRVRWFSRMTCVQRFAIVAGKVACAHPAIPLKHRARRASRIPLRKISDRLFAFFAPLVVCARCKIVLDLGVADDEANAGRNGDKLEIQESGNRAERRDLFLPMHETN